MDWIALSQEKIVTVSSHHPLPRHHYYPPQELECSGCSICQNSLALEAQQEIRKLQEQIQEAFGIKYLAEERLEVLRNRSEELERKLRQVCCHPTTLTPELLKQYPSTTHWKCLACLQEFSNRELIRKQNEWRDRGGDGGTGRGER